MSDEGGAVTYRHYLTMRVDGPRQAFAYSSMNADSESSLLADAVLIEAVEAIRSTYAGRLECRPDRIMVYIVNHTVTTL
jgi:hypothetical protein